MLKEAGVGGDRLKLSDYDTLTKRLVGFLRDGTIALETQGGIGEGEVRWVHLGLDQLGNAIDKDIATLLALKKETQTIKSVLSRAVGDKDYQVWMEVYQWSQDLQNK